MDNRLLRMLIYLFSGLIVVFSLLILVNYIGSMTGSSSGLPGQEEDAKTPQSASELAQQALNLAKYGAPPPTASMVPGYRKGLSTSSVNAEGSINIVKEKEFGGVAETPKGMMDMLTELSGGDKKKPSPVALTDTDLDKKITVGGVPGKEPRLGVSTMPELGRRPGQEGLTMLSAAVDYKLFKSSDTWAAFASSRKVKSPELDFNAYNLVILVSLSDFPSGIFSIAGVERGRKETVVKYRVNPLAMAAETSRDSRESYAMSPVPKGVPVRLEQVP